MITELKWESTKVSWIKNKKIEVTLSDVFLVTVDQENLIHIKCGENFKEEQEYIYDVNGNMIFYFNLLQKEIEWNYAEKKHRINDLDFQQVIPFMSKNKIMILLKSQKILVYSLSNEKIFEVNSPYGYKIKYLSSIDNKMVAVCDGDDNHYDKFGRNRINFYINKITGELNQGNLSY